MKRLSIVLILVALVSMVLLVYMRSAKTNREGDLPQHITSTSTVSTSVLSAASLHEYTSKDFHYSIKIPDGWRIIKMTPEDNGELRLTNSKDTDQEIFAYIGAPGSPMRTSPRAVEFFSSMIAVIPAYYEKNSIPPPVGQQINVGTTSVRETLLTSSGSQVVYKFRTEDKRPQSGVANVTNGGLLTNGSVSNQLLIIFPVLPVFSDKEARSFLASLQLL